MSKVLFLTLSPINSASERYRIHQFLPYLEQAGYACTVRPFASRALHRAIQTDRLAPKLLCTPLCYLRRAIDFAELAHYDAVVVHRGIFPFPWPAMEREFVFRNPKVIFDFDDALHVGHRDTATTKYPWIYKLKYGPGVNEILQKCRHVIAGNPTLADYASRFNSDVSIIPTVVDLQRYTFEIVGAASEVLTIGWVGSRSTSPYLLDVEAALRRLSVVHSGKVKFRFYGDPNRKLDLPNCESLPFSLRSEIEDLRTLDIGIMPMPDNSWTRGKCAFKAIQYMALGIPVVTSPVGMATEVVQHNMNGLWASTSEDWFEALNRLVLDMQLRKQFAEQGRKTVETRYSLQTWAPRVLGLLQGVIDSGGAAVNTANAQFIEAGKS
jgi:glycosyltransferase involved in cell wall biosynthesis